MDLLPKEREDAGLESVFSSVFPISDFRGLSQLEFVDYSIGNWECKCGNLKGLHHLRTICRNPNCGAEIRTDPFHAGDVLCHKCGTFNKNIVTFCNRCGDPVALQLKYDVPECEERGMTYAAPLKVTIRLTVYDKDADTGNKTVRDIKEQEVFFGEIPLMTENGTFIINGTERVIVSQLHRSPGVFFEKVPTQGYFLGKIIPYRGSWVEFEYDNKNLLYVRIDRKRKFYGTVFLRALGLKTDAEIIKAFYKLSTISVKENRLFWHVSDSLVGMKLSHAVTSKSGDTVVPQGRKITNSVFRELQKAKIEQVEVAVNDLEGAYVAADVIDMETGEVLVEANHELTAAAVTRIADAGIAGFEVFFPERDDAGNVISTTLRKDAVKTQNDALLEIYRKLRPGDPPTLDTATQLFQGMFFDPRKYDFSRVGRMKFNIKLYDSADQRRSTSARLTIKTSSTRFSICCAAPWPRRGGRYRSPGQPPCARGGRTARKSVPDRPGSYGTRHQRKDVGVPGNVDGDAARPGERETRHGGDPRILRLEPAFAVHGPDEPAVGDHAQAASFGARTGRSCLASAPASKSATSTRRTMAASARLKRRKARTSV